MLKLPLKLDRLDVNARVFHRVLDAAYIGAIDSCLPIMVASFHVPTPISFEITPEIYPHARVWIEKELAGYLLIVGNVSRCLLRQGIGTEHKDAITRILRTCVCRAGHVFLVRLRLVKPIECSCNSTLSAWSESISKTGRCPFLHIKTTSITVGQLLYYSILVADQRYLLQN